MHAINQRSLAKSAGAPGRLPAAAGRPAAAARGLGAALDDASRGGGVRPVPGAQARDGGKTKGKYRTPMGKYRKTIGKIHGNMVIELGK